MSTIVWREEKKDRIKTVLDSSDLIFFFKFKNDLFGASESSRMTFAKLKDKDDEDDGWRKYANFTATNLYKFLDGEQNQTVFTEKDLKDIKVVGERSQVEKLLADK